MQMYVKGGGVADYTSYIYSSSGSLAESIVWLFVRLSGVNPQISAILTARNTKLCKKVDLDINIYLAD